MDKCTRPRQPERMVMKTPRVAVRALILQEDRLLLVNAYAGAGNGASDLWCAPGGGVDAGTSLPENLMREVMEETGLTIGVGAPALINEFHDPKSGFHQVEVFFRCTVIAGQIDTRWKDPEGVVTERRWCGRADLAQMRFKPDMLADAAWGGVPIYDPLEVIVP
jgi:8-oxo-dGTP diphosphatase